MTTDKSGMRNVFVAVALILGCALRADAQMFEAVGTRAQGMGGAFVAVADDATASWWNPAGLATGKLFSLVLDRGTFDDPDRPPLAGPARRESASGFSVAFPSMALSYYRLRVSEIAPASSTAAPPSDRQDLGTGEVRLRALGISQFGLTVAQSLGGHLVLGSTLKLLRADAAESLVVDGDDLLNRAAGLYVSGDIKTDLDIGAMAALGNVRLGVTVKHVKAPTFGEGETRFTMERQARAGVAFMTPADGRMEVTAAVDVDLTTTRTVNGDVRRLASGVEVWLSKRRLGVRTGVSRDTVGPSNTTGSAGISVAAPFHLSFNTAILFGSDRGRSGLNTAISVTF